MQSPEALADLPAPRRPRLMPRLAEKIALITGAARGIGAAIASAFIAGGAWMVVLTDMADRSGSAARLRRGYLYDRQRTDHRRRPPGRLHGGAARDLIPGAHDPAQALAGNCQAR